MQTSSLDRTKTEFNRGKSAYDTFANAISPLTHQKTNMGTPQLFNTPSDYGIYQGGIGTLMMKRMEEVKKKLNSFYPVMDSLIPTATPIPTKMPTQKPVPMITPTPPQKRPGYELTKTLPQEKIDFLNNTIFPITRALGIPDALTAGQWAEEGGRIISSPKNNFFGLMSGGKLISYPTVEAGVRAYAQTVNNILAKKGYTVKQLGDDAYKILIKLQEGKRRYEAHYPDPYLYAHKIMGTPEFKHYYQ